MELPVIERFPHWLRWFLVLPAAVAAYAVVQLINAVFAPAPDWVIRWFSSFADPCAFVLVGSLTAPKARFAVSVVLAIVISAAQSLIVIVGTARGMEPGPDLWAAALIGIVGAVAGAAMVRELMQRSKRLRIAFFALDMLPRILTVVLVTMILGFIYRRVVAPPTIAVWNLIVTVVVSIALARVCGDLLIVTAASMVDWEPTSLTSEVSLRVAIGLASPNLTRFWLTRLGLYLALGVVFGLLFIVLDLIASSRTNLLEAFSTGPMSSVVYGYLATGWELAGAVVAVSPRSSRSP